MSGATMWRGVHHEEPPIPSIDEPDTLRYPERVGF